MIVHLHRYLGGVALRLLGTDIKSALLEEIQTACLKAAADSSTPPLPTKRCRSVYFMSIDLPLQFRICLNDFRLTTLKSNQTSEAEVELGLPTSEKMAAELLEQQIPRICIKDFITPQIVKVCSIGAVVS